MLEMRTHQCGELTKDNVNQSVILQGWANFIRDKSQVIFLVLRDRSGFVQVTIDEECAPSLFQTARNIRLEFTVQVKGRVRARDAAAINAAMSTGEIEIVPETIEVLSSTKPLPFTIGEQTQTSEEVRLKYRYLDLRQPHLQRNLAIRHKAALAARVYLDEIGFYEIETPILNRSTPEGARDYLVPSRVHPGTWYALPQSPQIFKQLLMVGGMDRYFQIVKCFRDEDLRADRQPEFTQIDMEMSFVTADAVMETANGIIRHMWKSIGGEEVGEIPTMTYAEAIQRFGVDNPDLRFDMELFDFECAQTEFRVLKGAIEAGGIARGIVVKGGSDASRKTIDKDYTPFVRNYKLGGLLWGKRNADGWSGPLSKVESEILATIPDVEAGDLVLVGAGNPRHVNTAIGRLRSHVAKSRDLIPTGKYAFCWVTQFPAFEHDEENDRWVAVHHPFTKPVEDHLHLLETDRLGEVLSDAYDIVCNGYEIGGGSIRIHDSEVQKRVFTALGLSMEEAREKFGFLMDALQYGAPPHGGIALGFDRCVMLLAQTDNIRDVIAFPKTTKAQDLMAGCPNTVAPEQLKELYVNNTN